MVETDLEPTASSLLPSSALRRAATLAERVESTRAANGAWHAHNNGKRDVERGRRRLDEWRAQDPFSRSALFQERLAQAGLTEAELADLLSEPAEPGPALCELCEQYGDLTAADGEPPAWAQMINQALTAPLHLDLPPFPEELRDKPACGLLGLVRPLMGRAVAQLRDKAGKLTAPSGERPLELETVSEILFRPLPDHLLSLLLRTLALELHVARLQGLLHGETPEERFQSFVGRLGQPEVALEMLGEYPVLARQIVTCLDNWLSVSLEFLERWCADWPAIRTTFSPDQDPGALVGIEADAGDSHRCGRSVIIARCASGFQVVYKPKALAVDQHFQELLGWLNERGASPPFRQIKILDCGRYGWAEFVSSSACSSALEVERFYRREGGYLALLYALAASDFHYENVIASGEQPMLVDLETLFHPREQDSYVKPADHLAGKALDDSVLGSMLLPQPMRMEFDSQALDLSGMAAEPGSQLPWRYPGFVGQGTDEMQFARKTEVIATSDHRPSLSGAPVGVLDHAADIEAGFCQVYDLLARHREELLASNGPLAPFAEDEVRVLLRATAYYREFLDEGSHPDVLRDALDRDRLFDRLWEGVDERPRQIRFIPAEVADLWRGDIPFFTTRPDSRDLWSSTGERFPDEFQESGMELVRRRLSQLGDQDLARQLWFLRASLTTLTSENDAGVHAGYDLPLSALPRPAVASRGCQQPDSGGGAANPQRLLAAARDVGDWLAEHAIHGPNGDVNWVGLTLVRDEQWWLLPLGMDLYDGVPGVTLFLAHLGAITSEECYTTLARAGLKTLRRRLLPHKRLKTVQCLGGFSGWGGVLYTLAHLGSLWNEPEIFAEAHELVSVLPDLIEKDKYFDLGLGAAGCIAGLLCLGGRTPSQQTVAVATQCGEHLLARARPMPRGIAWDWSWPSRGPLTGYSHGAAGIALTLLQLAAQTGGERFRSAALQAMEYERSLFSAEAGNWPDLRLFGTSPEAAGELPPRYSVTWCYGAPGIGLARLRSLPFVERGAWSVKRAGKDEVRGMKDEKKPEESQANLSDSSFILHPSSFLDDPVLRQEIDIALSTTLAKGFGLSHILCHGDLGNLELLLEAARAFPGSPWRAEADRLAAGILNSINRDGWLCGNPRNLASPGLMTGISGIGYQLLRLADPERVPSILTLRPPAGAAPSPRDSGPLTPN